MPMTTAERKRLDDLEAWKTQHVANQQRDLAAIDARLDALEGGVVPQPPPPAEPPPPEPVPNGTVVSSLAGLTTALTTSATDIILRGGTYEVSYYTIRRGVRLWAYQGEVPTFITAPGKREDGVYVTTGPLEFHGIVFRAGSGDGTVDSMGAAVTEVDGADTVLYESCEVHLRAGMDDRKQGLYQRYGKHVTVRATKFYGHGALGFGFHQYPGVTTDPVTLLEDCYFEGFASTAAAITTDSRITVRRGAFKDCYRAVQLRNSAGGSVIEQCQDLGGVVQRVQNPGLAAVNTWA